MTVFITVTLVVMFICCNRRFSMNFYYFQRNRLLFIKTYTILNLFVPFYNAFTISKIKFKFQFTLKKNVDAILIKKV